MLRLFLVNAFVDGPFSGNPAAVVLDDHEDGAVLDGAAAQALAAQLNQPATAFVARGEGLRRPLRWFSPSTELALCGHGTLAAAHVLREVGDASPGETVTFATPHAAPAARIEPERIVLDFPTLEPDGAAPPPALVAAAGVEPVDVAHHGGRYVLVLRSEDDVARAQPDTTAPALTSVHSLILTARTGPATFVARVFAPSLGIPEDHATGSGHCLLAPYWAGVTGVATWTARQVSPRGGLLDVHLDGGRVRIGGRAATVARGVLAIRP